MGVKRTPMEHSLPHGVRERVFEYQDMHGNTMKAGDRVRIEGDLDGRYELKHIDIMERDFEMAIAWIWGGPSGHALWRSPQTDRVYLEPSGRKARQASSQEGTVEQAATTIDGRRKALKLSRGQLSELAGVGIPAIATLEAGKEPRDKEARAKVYAALEAKEAEAGIEVPPHDEIIIIDDGPTLYDQIITEKFGGVHPSELAALGFDPFEEDD